MTLPLPARSPAEKIRAGYLSIDQRDALATLLEAVQSAQMLAQDVPAPILVAAHTATELRGGPW